MNLKDYITLGRSGLRVSPLCLGTMTYGTDWGFGADEQTARNIFTRYPRRAGIFDTADGYMGNQRKLVEFYPAGFARPRGACHKFTFNNDQAIPTEAEMAGRISIARSRIDAAAQHGLY